MTTLAVLAFTLLDGLTDAAGWSLFRRWNVPNLAYQGLRFVVLRVPMLYGVYLIAETTGSGLFAVLLCCPLMIWAATSDTIYHLGLRILVKLRIIPTDDGPLLDGLDHGHKGPVLPRIAAWMVGDDVQSESEYRTGSVSAGLALALAAACYDLVLLL